MITADEVRAMELPELEKLYLARMVPPMPGGRFRGELLEPLESRAASKRRWRLASTLLFEVSVFGVDFDARHWFFWNPAFGAGRFTLRRAPSRWRDTETLALDYDTSAIPQPVRRLLYDEVKPLTDDLCLGLGGINAPKGEGELFFFLLWRA